MDTQQIVFYLKRHLLGIVGLLLSIGFIVGGIMFKGKFADKVTGAEEAYSNAKKKRDEIQGSANETKVDGANVAVLGDVADEYRKFIADAGQVLKKESFPAMKSNDFLNLMTQTIVLLNQEATNNLVKVRNDLLTRSDINFSFTFAPLMEQAEIAEDKIPELQVQMEDIKTISQVLFESQVRSLELLQRNRVTTEDFAALQNPNYLDIRDKYTNSISVVRPYRIKFRSLSGGIAKGDSNSNILVYTVPVPLDKRDFIKTISQIRDTIGKKYLPGRNENMFMITEKAFTPRVFKTKLNGKTSYRTHGKWEVLNDFMAGPFLNYAIEDLANNRWLIIEGFTYAPSVDKRDYMFELEAVLKTVQF